MSSPILTLSKECYHVAVSVWGYFWSAGHTPLLDQGLLSGKCGSDQSQISLHQDPLLQHQVLLGYLFYTQTILLVMNLFFNKWILIKVCVDLGLQYYFQLYAQDMCLHTSTTARRRKDMFCRVSSMRCQSKFVS